jgi:hypothetical protein
MRSGRDLGLVAAIGVRPTDDVAENEPRDDEPRDDQRRPPAAALPVERLLPTLRAMDYNHRADAVIALAGATSGPLPNALVDEALGLPPVNLVERFSPRTWVISTLADRFPEDRLSDVVRAAMELPHRLHIGDAQVWGWNRSHEYPRGAALNALAPRLRGELAATAFAAARELPWIPRGELLQPRRAARGLPVCAPGVRPAAAGPPRRPVCP